MDDTHALSCVRTLLRGCVVTLMYIDCERDENIKIQVGEDGMSGCSH